MHSRHSAVLAAASLIAFAAGAHAGENWPQFRGAGSRGVSEGAGLPERWSATENIEWKTDVDGRGWSSPVVWGKRVFLTSVVNLGVLEPPKKGLYFGGNRPKPKSIHEWYVICLDLDTGKVLWKRRSHRGVPGGSIHVKSSFASETPVTDGERVYAMFGNQGIYCYDFDGRPVWQKKLTPHKTRFGWGTAASPVLHGERLYLVDDNEEDSCILALDRKTGSQVWRTPRDEKSNWSTPFVWENDRRTEVVTPGTGKVRSYDLDGRLLWTLRGMSSITIATPFEHEGLLFISSGYVGDKNWRPIYAIRPGARGDITLAEGATTNGHIAWSRRLAAPYNPTTIAYRGMLYVLHDRGRFSCYRASDGSVIYERERTGGRGFTSSPWAYGGKVFCLDEDGVTHVVRAGRGFEVLRHNRLADDDMCMATPAIAGDRLLIRTSARVYCVRKRR